MRSVALWVLCLGALLGAGPASRVEARDNVEAARALAARIDHYIASRWAADKVVAAVKSGDAEFFRRISVDLTGRIPTLTDMRDFIDDDRPDKRWIWAEEMLTKKINSDDGNKNKTYYAAHFAAVWREIMLPQSNNPQVQFFAASLETWLRQRLDKNVGYDKIARELITAPVNGGVDDGFGQMGRNTAGPSVYYQANELKPENLAANTSRLFLGHKLECAQCHNHPFAKWTRKQFWEYAAFFSGINPQGGDQPNTKQISYKVNGADKMADAKFLDGTDPTWQDGKATRAVLADWITRRENPFFARATVNKVWAYFFGIGLVDPLDEPSDENPPSHPELLDELAKEFASHDFDLKYLIRAIVASKAYQLSSVASHPSQAKHPRTFARMAVRGMSPEQLFDSVCVAIDFKDNTTPNMMNIGFNNNPQSPRAQFLARFANQERRNEMETSILQALFMMNGKFMAEATSLKNNKNLAIIADFSEKNLPKTIEQVYLVTLSRLPTEAESARMTKYVMARQKSGHGKKAYEDLLWALLNSAEFMLNH